MMISNSNAEIYQFNDDMSLEAASDGGCHYTTRFVCTFGNFKACDV